MRLAPLANRIDELLMVVERWNDDPAPERLAWLVQAMSTVDESALEQCAAALAERIMIIHNISPVKRGKVIKPSEFNDFETRINRLIPVLRALSCISKAAPEVVAVSGREHTTLRYGAQHSRVCNFAGAFAVCQARSCDERNEPWSPLRAQAHARAYRHFSAPQQVCSDGH